MFKILIISVLLSLFVCTMTFSQTRWEAYTFAAPINLSIDGNRIKNEDANIGKLTTFHENTYEVGLGIRFYHKKNFGYELGGSLKNYKIKHIFEIPGIEPADRLTYSSRIDIDMGLYGIRTGIFYKYKKLTGKLLIELNQPYKITGIGPRNNDYNIDDQFIMTTNFIYRQNEDFELEKRTLIVEHFSMADDAVFYTIPELVLEYKISKHFDIYTGFKSRWYSKKRFHKIETVLTDYVEDTEQTQLIEMHHNFFFFSIGLRGSIQFGKKF